MVTGLLRQQSRRHRGSLRADVNPFEGREGLRSGSAGVPTVMMFVQSLHGISHNKIEDTKEERLELCVTAFDKLAEKAMAWVKAKEF